MRIGRIHAMAVSVWVMLLAGGLGAMGAHASKSGAAGDTPEQWPAGLTRVSDRWTVVLAAHPRCPCTRATVDELMAALRGATEAYELVVLAYMPRKSEDFAETGVIRRLGALPNTTIIRDADGRTAARFGAMTSGHAAVYDPAGRLRFRGGLTPTRAHVGPNTGAVALRALLQGGSAPATESPVYGCPLDNTAHPLLGSCTAEGESPCTP